MTYQFEAKYVTHLIVEIPYTHFLSSDFGPDRIKPKPENIK